MSRALDQPIIEVDPVTGVEDVHLPAKSGSTFREFAAGVTTCLFAINRDDQSRAAMFYFS
jgi:hypothetical protein